ncbi:hypothetical protein PMAYCL1PPCAC_16586, partial [Pristionchus mayeri]
AYNLEKGTVGFWKWIDEETLTFVTKSHVYDWSMTVDTKPYVWYERHDSLSTGKIVNYRIISDYVVLIGENGRTFGRMPLSNNNSLGYHSFRPFKALEGEAARFKALCDESNVRLKAAELQRDKLMARNEALEKKLRNAKNIMARMITEEDPKINTTKLQRTTSCSNGIINHFHNNTSR